PGQGQRGGTPHVPPGSSATGSRPGGKLPASRRTRTKTLNLRRGRGTAPVSSRNHLRFLIVVDPWGPGFGSRYGDRDGHFAGEMPPLRRLAHGRVFSEAEIGAARNTVQMCAVPPSRGRSVAAGGKRPAP